METNFSIRPIGRYHEQITQLYTACGWVNYTSDPQLLENAYRRSLRALGAYAGGKLIGAARAVGDGCSILYIQDILVLPEYRRRGVGSSLMHALMLRYPLVYQTVLMADADPGLIKFYERNGFSPADGASLRAFVRIRP